MPNFIKGTNGADTLEGTAGADKIFGLNGADKINGMEGANEIHGGGGNDTITTGKGRDVIYGDDGNDIINVFKNYSGTFVLGGNGDDTVSLQGVAQGTTLSLDYQRGDYGSSTLDSIDVQIRDDRMVIDKDFSSSTSSDDVVGLTNLGPDGTVHLFGSSGDDFIDGDGRDSPNAPRIIFHADGSDTFDGSADAYEEIVFSQNSGFDSATSTYYQFNKIIITGNSSGQMTGRSDYDYWDGTSNSTVTTRFSAMDMIEGSTGDDLLVGSAGADKFRPGYGNDGFEGGKGVDTVYYDANGIVSATVDLLYGYADSLFSNDGAFDDFSGVYASDRFVFEDQMQHDGLRSVENAVGSDGDDVLRGSNGANVLDGGEGDDNLNGRKGHDTLIGGDGDDNLRGLLGKDKYQFDTADGSDKIFSFKNSGPKKNVDKIVFDGEGDSYSFSDVKIVDHGRHALVTFEDTSITIIDFDHTDLKASDFLFI